MEQAARFMETKDRIDIDQSFALICYHDPMHIYIFGGLGNAKSDRSSAPVRNTYRLMLRSPD